MQQMQQELNAFEKFYKDKRMQACYWIYSINPTFPDTGRGLRWQPSVGTVTMMGYFTAGNKELSVSLYQSTVLLLFNSSPELSFSDIFEETKLGKLF
jgi:cullin-4